MEFSRQEYRSGLPFPSPGDLPDPVIKPGSLTLQTDSLLSEPLGTTANSDKSRHRIKKQRHYFANKGLSSQRYGFSSSHVWMWDLEYKESWAPKNWCCLTVVLERSLESHLNSKEIQPVHPKGNEPWIFTGRTDAEAPVLWPPDVKSRLTGKVPDAGKVEGRRVTENEMIEWHYWLWTWVWVTSRSWWWTGKPGVLQSMGLQRVGHDWVTDWTGEPGDQASQS